MHGRALLRLFDSVYLVALGVWLGSTLFSVFGAGPALRRDQAKSDDLDPVRMLLTRCTLWGAVCGALALPALVCGALSVPELRGIRVGLQAGAVLCALLLTLFAANIAARGLSLVSKDASGNGSRQRLNALLSLVAVIVIALLVAHAHRDMPSSKGLVDPKPGERYQEAQQRLQSQNQRMWSEEYKKNREAAAKETAVPGAEGKNAVPRAGEPRVAR